MQALHMTFGAADRKLGASLLCCVGGAAAHLGVPHPFLSICIDLHRAEQQFAMVKKKGKKAWKKIDTQDVSMWQLGRPAAVILVQRS